ncbi:hypothetical protein AC579_10091 [Pseudocercospora musae]|uniref:Uncharacterized protein n=1 Tax=Pseudocercospora musae TaxID=113226 RepID=A0A139IGQ0_9PEZI|nr:hypothetical protein AC579_10091 [Pseudocercospora musae]
MACEPDRDAYGSSAHRSIMPVCQLADTIRENSYSKAHIVMLAIYYQHAYSRSLPRSVLLPLYVGPSASDHLPSSQSSLEFDEASTFTRSIGLRYQALGSDMRACMRVGSNRAFCSGLSHFRPTRSVKSRAEEAEDDLTLSLLYISTHLTTLGACLGLSRIQAHVSYPVLVVIRGFGRYSSCTVDGEVDRREVVAGGNTTRR